MAYVITDLNDFEIQISDGFRDIVIWKQNIRFGAIVGNNLTLYWHNKAQTDTQYQLTIDWNDVTAPVVASAAALQSAIEAMIISGWGGGSGISLSAGGVTVSSGTVVFSNANSVTFGMAGSTVTASVSSPAQSEYFFSNSNGVSFGTAGSTVTASHNGITSQSVQTQNSVQVQGSTGNISFANSNGITFGGNASTITASYTVPTVTNSSWTASAGTQSATVSQLVFSNSNGISFGLNNGTITGSHNGLTVQSSQPINFSITANAGTISATSGSGYNFSISGLGDVVAGISANTIYLSHQKEYHTVTAANGSFTYQNIWGAFDSNGIGFSTINLGGTSGLIASHNGLTSQSNQAISGSNGSFTFQTVTFGNLNGLSFYTSNGSLVGSYTVPAGGTPALSGSNGSFTYNTATFGNLNGMSFYTSNGSMVGSYTVPTVTNSSWTVSDSATSGTVGRLAFTNLNGVTLSLSSGTGGLHTIVGSHNGLTSQSNQALSGSNGSFTFQTATFGNLNGASFYTSNGSIVLSYTVPAAGGALSFSAGTTSNTLNSLVFSDANGVSFGLNGSTVTASVNAGAGGDITLSQWPDVIKAPSFAGAVNSGTVGSTGGSSQVTASYHVASMQVPHPVVFDNIFGLYAQTATSAGTGSATWGQAFGIYSLNANTALSLVSSFQFQMYVSQNSISARTHRWFWGNASSTNSSSLSGNVSASFTGPSGSGRRFPFLENSTLTLQTGNYYLVSVITVSSAGLNVMPLGSQAVIEGAGVFANLSGFGSSNVTRAYGFDGVFSSTTNRSSVAVPIMPSSINTSAITLSANANYSNTFRQPYIIFERSKS